MPEHHDMVLAGRTESGAEEWVCPDCGRRMLMRWPPRFEKIVLEDGDSSAIHAGAKGGALMRKGEVTQAIPTDVPDAERRWLHSNGIDWNDPHADAAG